MIKRAKSKNRKYFRVITNTAVYSLLILIILVAANIAYIKLYNNYQKHSQEKNNMLLKYKNSLIDGKLALWDYNKLLANDASFYDTKEYLVQKIKILNDYVLNNSQTDLPKINKKSDLNLVTAAQKIFISQVDYIKKIDAYSSLVRNIYLYQPHLIALDADDAWSEENLSRVHNGLVGIKNNLQSEYKNGKSAPVIQKINECDTLLKKLIAAPVEEKEIHPFILCFKELRNATFDVEKSLLFDEQFYEILTEQTNLILEFGL